MLRSGCELPGSDSGASPNHVPPLTGGIWQKGGGCARDGTSREGPVRDMLEILDDIEHYVHRMGGRYDAWHIGVTTDVKRSLIDHGVDGSPCDTCYP